MMALRDEMRRGPMFCLGCQGNSGRRRVKLSTHQDEARFGRLPFKERVSRLGQVLPYFAAIGATR